VVDVSHCSIPGTPSICCRGCISSIKSKPWAKRGQLMGTRQSAKMKTAPHLR